MDKLEQIRNEVQNKINAANARGYVKPKYLRELESRIEIAEKWLEEKWDGASEDLKIKAIGKYERLKNQYQRYTGKQYEEKQ